MDPDEQDPQSGSPAASADPASPAPGAITAPDWEADDNPYKKRFEGYRSDADRKITRLSQYEQAVEDFQTGEPDKMRRAAAILGIDSVVEIEDPPAPTYDDPSDELRAQYNALQEEFKALRGELTAKEQKAQEAAQAAELQRRLDSLKIEDEQDRSVVLGVAFTLPMGEDGLPDVAAAHKFIEERDTARQRSWGERKRRTPGSIAPGSTATQQKPIHEMVGPDGRLSAEGLAYAARMHEDRLS